MAMKEKSWHMMGPRVHRPLTPLQQDSRVAVYSGMHNGMGFSILRQLGNLFNNRVYYVTTNLRQALPNLRVLENMGINIRGFHLDAKRRDSYNRLVNLLREAHGGIDILINNFSVSAKFESGNYTSRTYLSLTEVQRTVLKFNFYSAFYLSQFLLPLIRPHGRLINVADGNGLLHRIPSQEIRDALSSSNLTYKGLHAIIGRYKVDLAEGSNAESRWGNSTYVVARVATNALTRVIQRDFDTNRPDDMLLANSFNPGRTARSNQFAGQHRGLIKPIHAASKLLWLALLPNGTQQPAGQILWHDLSVVNWTGPQPSY